MAILVVYKGVPNVPMHTAQASDLTWKQVVFQPELMRLNLGIFMLHLVQMAMFVVVPLMLVQQLGIPVKDHGLKIYLPVMLGAFVLMLPPVIWSEKKGKVRVVFLGSVALLVLVEGLLSTSVATQSWSLIILMLLFFVGFNVLEASLPSLVSRFAPPKSKGLALGVYNTSQSLGLFAGGWLGGRLSASLGATGVFEVCSILLLIWLVLAWPMKPPARVRLQKSSAAPT